MTALLAAGCAGAQKQKTVVVKALKESYPDIKWQEGILTTVE